MTVAAKMKGQIKETTGKLTGNTGMEVEGKIEKGVAEVKRVVEDGRKPLLRWPSQSCVWRRLPSWSVRPMPRSCEGYFRSFGS